MKHFSKILNIVLVLVTLGAIVYANIQVRNLREFEFESSFLRQELGLMKEEAERAAAAAVEAEHRAMDTMRALEECEREK